MALFLLFAVTLVTTMRIKAQNMLVPYAMRVVLWRLPAWFRQVNAGSHSGARCLRFTRVSLLIALTLADVLLFPICEDLPQ
jgi:hypothetical protein